MNENSMNNAVTMRPQSGASLGRIDQYELIRELGGGGFGCVYLARDTVAGIEVAVKGLPPLVRLNKEELENVRQNFALVSRLYHPNIAAALTLHPVTNAFYNDKTDAEKLRVFKGDTLVVMQYARGVTLSQWRKQFPEGKVPLDKALEITRQIASALDYAHEEKILHRDIKPANVMIETGGDGKITARVLDFGLAAEIRSSMSRVSQQVCDTSGTRPYMAPEQWGGWKQGKETDLYSLAVLFYELVSGEVPFASVFDTGDPVLMMNVIETKNPELSSGLSKPIRRALIQALAKKREDRFESCIAFVDALVGRGVLTAPSGKTFGKIAAVGLLVLGLVGGVWYWQGEKAKEEARVAAEQKAEEECEAAEEARRIADEKAKKEKAEAERKQKEEAARIAAEKDAERKAELEVFRLSSKTQSAHDLIDRESVEIKEFFAKEIRAFENDRRAGDDAKQNSKYVVATNFYVQALMAVTALKGSVTKYQECKELLPKIECAKERADEVNAAESLPSGYRAAQEAQNVALAAFKAKRFDECKVKRQEAESLFVSLRTDVISAVLDSAESHKNNERWEECLKEVEKVLKWEKQNPRALELAKKSENHLAPVLTIVARIGTNETKDAKICIDGKIRILPYTMKDIGRGDRIGPFEVLCAMDGKEYSGTFAAVTAAWHGHKTVSVDLSEYAEPQTGDTETMTLPGGAVMEMIYVRPGVFMMGSENGNNGEYPVHQVTLTKGFWLGKYEVKQSQWESVMGLNPSRFRNPDNPVENVSWEDCQEFAEKVNSVIRCGARLPTEAEWEYACRAGSAGKYSGTGVPHEMGWLIGNSKDQTHPVGRKQANAWGFHDMHGNVYEWCQDKWRDYTSEDVVDPVEVSTRSSFRINRGCSWNTIARQLTGSAYRGVGDQKKRGRRGYYGFRLACSVKNLKSAVAFADATALTSCYGKTVSPVSEGKSSDAHKAGDTKTIILPGGAKMEMIYVAPGSFMMGDDDWHYVTLTKGYWLGKYEVTQAQWESVMGDNPSYIKGPDMPVSNISWNDCQMFIRKVGESRKCAVRLPTEAEWEYACRAGTDGGYAGTGKIDEMGWYWRNSGDKIKPIGGKLPNAWGFYDMHGNVLEWCQDWYGDYSSASVVDPSGPDTGSSRVTRGGYMSAGADVCTSFYRSSNTPFEKNSLCGFRLACSAVPREDSEVNDVVEPQKAEQDDVKRVQLWEGGPYWATKNIGAEKPEDYGYYFWWGDTVGYKRVGEKWVAVKGYNTNFSFSTDNAPTYGKSFSGLEREGWIEKKDGTYVLTSRHDAAQAHWKGAWRMPTKEEFDDLDKKCDWTWGTRNDVDGYVVRGRGNYASKSIFLPAAGGGDGNSLFYSGSGGYWSSVPGSDSYGAYQILFDSGSRYTYKCDRYRGQPVRPVQGFTK